MNTSIRDLRGVLISVQGGRLLLPNATVAEVITTGHGDVAMAVDMLKNGAADFFTKPYSISEILRAIQTAAEKRILVLENRRLRSALSNRGKVGVIGTSSAAETLRNVFTAVAEADIDAVLVGATGTGKTYAARLLHDLSPRASRPFITIDPGLVAHRDAELVLFGREPGSLQLKEDAEYACPRSCSSVDW